MIQSEAAGIQVRLLRDGDEVEDLTVQHGVNSTRVRAGNYEVVIDQPSDAWVISDNTFTLRQGETVVTRITLRDPGLMAANACGMKTCAPQLNRCKSSLFSASE